MTNLEMADVLEADATALEDFASYVEANRDDWFCTAPGDMEDKDRAKAARYRAAAQKLRQMDEAPRVWRQAIAELDAWKLAPEAKANLLAVFSMLEHPPTDFDVDVSTDSGGGPTANR